jgi:hypothetical protein
MNCTEITKLLFIVESLRICIPLEKTGNRQEKEEEGKRKGNEKCDKYDAVPS